MKKLLYILFAISLSVSFIACGGDDDEKTTDPLKGDDKTIEEIIGEYEIYGAIEFVNGNLGIDYMTENNIKFKFKNDYLVEEVNNLVITNESDWRFNNRVLYFETSVHGEVQAWFKSNQIKFRAKVPNYSNEIGTYTFRKIK